MRFKNNEELKRAVKDGVLDCKREDLICPFNISINADIVNARNITAWNITARNINACNINACNINARNITAWNITANNITARNISYYAVCFAYENIVCDSISGERDNCKHFVLDGEIKIREKEEREKEVD